jgi:hypothetical protein
MTLPHSYARRPVSPSQHGPANPSLAGRRLRPTALSEAGLPPLRLLAPEQRQVRKCRPMFAAMLAAAALGSGVVVYEAMTLLPPTQEASGPSPADLQALYLARSTLMALSDANRSGNYSVLRDLAGPRFRLNNSEARLADVFHGFRKANLDLGRVAIAPPEFAVAGVRDQDGMLLLRGSLALVDTPPLPAVANPRLAFAMEFEPIDQQWRLLTLDVAVKTSADGQAR